jgi:hypothetical protein
MPETQNFFDYIKDTFSETDIEFFEKYLKGNLRLFLEHEEIADKVILNEKALTWVIIDALIEAKRMKDYHIAEGNNVSMIRYRSFLGSYILKRHPLFPKEGHEDLYLVNEAWAEFLITSSILGEFLVYSESASQDVDGLLDALEHHLRYRNSNPQILELFCRALMVGSKCLAPRND